MCVGHQTTFIYADGHSQTHVDFTPCNRRKGEGPCSRAQIEDRGYNYVPAPPLDPTGNSSSVTKYLLAETGRATPKAMTSGVSGDVAVMAPPESPHRHRRRRSSKLETTEEVIVPSFFSLFRRRSSKKAEGSEDKNGDPNAIESSVVVHDRRRSMPVQAAAPPPRAPEPPNAAETGLYPPGRRSTEYTFRSPPTHLQEASTPQATDSSPYHWDPHLPRYEERVPPNRRRSQPPNTPSAQGEALGLLQHDMRQPGSAAVEVPQHRTEIRIPPPNLRVGGDDRNYFLPEAPSKGSHALTTATEAEEIPRLRLELENVKRKLRLAQAELAQNSALQVAARNAAEVYGQGTDEQELSEDTRGRSGKSKRDTSTKLEGGPIETGIYPIHVEETGATTFNVPHPKGRHSEHQEYMPQRATSNREPGRPRHEQSHQASSSDPPKYRRGSEKRAARASSPASSSSSTPTERAIRRRSRQQGLVPTSTSNLAPTAPLPEPEAPNARFDLHSTELSAYDKLYLSSRSTSQARRASPPTNPRASRERRSSRQRTPETSPSPPVTPYTHRRRRRHHRNTEENRHSYPSRSHPHTANLPLESDPDAERREARNRYWHGSGTSSGARTPTASVGVAVSVTSSTVAGSRRSREDDPVSPRTVRRSGGGSSNLREEFGKSARREREEGGLGVRFRDRGDGSARGGERPQTWWM